jgi:hypothetical protein
MDALCMVNLLRADPFYEEFFSTEEERADLEVYRAALGPEQRQALTHLTAQIHNLLSAELTGIFSVTHPATLDDLLRTVGDDDAWARLHVLLAGTRYEEVAQETLDGVRGDLAVLLRHLQTRGFSARWAAHALPEIQLYIRTGLPALQAADVVGRDEHVLGRALDVQELSAYVLKYAKPHGIRLEGWQFITDVSWPMPITLKTALHELLHPPFPRAGELDRQLSSLEKDPFFQRLVAEHNPAFGYQTAEGLTEEDCVTAVDVFNAEALGLALQPGPGVTAAEYFARHDDGIHVLAFILYQELRRADFSHWTTYPQFISSLFAQGKLGGGLEREFQSYPGHYEVEALNAAKQR